MNMLVLSHQKERRDKTATPITFFRWIPAAIKFSSPLVFWLAPVLFFFSFILLLSCTTTLSPDEYVKWVENPKNGLRSLKNSGELHFDVQFQPSDYLWLQSGKIMEYEESKVSNQGVQHYLLKITSQTPEVDWLKSGYDRSAYQTRLYYFSYLFQNDISVLENGLAIPCAMYHLEQAQGGNYTKTFLLGFENKFPSSETAVLTIKSEYLSSLPINIKISKNNIPNLKL